MERKHAIFVFLVVVVGFVAQYTRMQEKAIEATEARVATDLRKPLPPIPAAAIAAGAKEEEEAQQRRMAVRAVMAVDDVGDGTAEIH